MRNLMWKDLQQNRNVLLFVGVILGMFYILPPLFALPFDAGPGEDFIEFALVVSWLAIWATVFLMTPAIACSLIAGERADRSSQFAGYLPIPRKKAVASRFGVAILASLGFLVANGLVCLTCAEAKALGLFGPPAPFPEEAPWAALAVITLFLMMFGLACFWSALLSTPVQAMLAVLGTAAVLFILVLKVQWHLLDEAIHERLFLIVGYGAAPLLGLLTMGIGARICTRRLEL